MNSLLVASCECNSDGTILQATTQMQELVGFDGFIELSLAQVTTLTHGPSVNTITQEVLSLHIEARVSKLVLQIRPISKELNFLFIFFWKLIFTFYYWTEHFRKRFD